MSRPHESISLDLHTLGELYPFYLILKDNTDAIISNVGPALVKVMGGVAPDSLFSDLFSVERPHSIDGRYESLKGTKGKVVRLINHQNALSLRGQMVSIDADTLVFFGSINVTSDATLTDAGLSISDFPPSDLVPDVIILQRVKELQLSKLEKQNAELTNTIKERDQFDQYANTDELTGLLNRRGFFSRGKEFLKSLESTRSYSLVIADVNHFKTINDTFGHASGDAVLNEIATRLRQTFAEPALIGRWGGDEFVIIAEADTVVNLSAHDSSIMEMLQSPVLYEAKSMKISVTLGVVNIVDSSDIHGLIHCADLTMYESRREGEGKMAFFHGEKRIAIEYRDSISKRFETAMDDGAFIAHYQPLVNLGSGHIVGFEALARWPCEELGMISPADFISVAESKNLLVEFDTMMLGIVAKQLQIWNLDNPDIQIHINFSAPSFVPGLADRIQQTLAGYGVQLRSIVVELTETSLMTQSNKAHQAIQELVGAGIAVELDDFGTGFSSLLHLKDFPVTGVKVDVSFVRDALCDSKTRTLLSAIVELSNKLNLTTVAEGVETREQRDMLQEMNCQIAQGYFYSKPVSAADALSMLQYEKYGVQPGKAGRFAA